MKNAMQKFFRFLWGDVSRAELKKFSILSLALLCIIGASEIIRPIKDTIFIATVGKSLLPYAKIISLIILSILLMLYAKLVDWLEKHSLVYFLNSIISLFIFGVAMMLMHFPNIYTQHSFIAKIIGWITFVGGECSIVLLFTLYWSFLASSMDTITAKKGYPLIIAGARISSIIGPIMTLNVMKIGIENLLFIAGASILGAAMFIKLFSSRFPSSLEKTAYIKSKSTGAIEGLSLLFKHPYLIGIFFISVLPDIIGEILYFSMLFLAESHFQAPDKIIAFLGIYGIAVSCMSLVLSLLGAGFFLRRWGLNAWLLVYPLIISVIVLLTWLFYSPWVIVFGMAFLKSLGYALDQPCRDIMFIPTSKDIMFKSRGWVGAFGARFARGISASLVAFFSSLGSLVVYGSLASFCLIGIWIPIARYVGKINNKLVQEDKILE